MLANKKNTSVMLMTNNPVPTMLCNALREHSEHLSSHCGLLIAGSTFGLNITVVFSPLGLHYRPLSVQHLYTSHNIPVIALIYTNLHVYMLFIYFKI